MPRATEGKEELSALSLNQFVFFPCELLSSEFQGSAEGPRIAYLAPTILWFLMFNQGRAIKLVS